MNKLAIDHEYVSRRIIEFMRREVRNSGFEKVILGLSGGIDSSLVAFLAKEAFGKKNVHGVIMPYRTSSPKSEEDALKVVEAAKISWEKVEITNMVDSYFSFFPDASPLRKGNRMARERMCILYDLSARDHSLVMGTGNKTEMYLGYSTQYGDAACALLPIADLYKTQVWSLSEYLGVPKEVIEKKPSADLWEGQTDEGELGFSYRDADDILFELIDRKKDRNEVITLGFKSEVVDSILEKIKNSEFKRRMPKIAYIHDKAK